MPAKSFRFVYIPAAVSDPIEELEQALVEGKEVECLIDRLRAHFAAAAPGKSAAATAAQRAALAASLPAGTPLDEGLLAAATSLRMVENIALLPSSKAGGFVGVNMYADDEGSLRGAERNVRASEIAACCGHPLEVRGDAFLARVRDDGDEFERLDFVLGEVSSGAPWVRAARAAHEARRARGDAGAKLQAAAGAFNARGGGAGAAPAPAPAPAPRVVELSPGEAAKEEGNEAFRRGAWEAAAAAYARALELEPEMPAALNNRAQALLKLGRWVEAEADAGAVLAADGDNVKALLRRGAARSALGRAAEARADYEAALAAQPQNAAARAALAAL
jgi:tetratricopeptide (TPR) repeat protein